MSWTYVLVICEHNKTPIMSGEVKACTNKHGLTQVLTLLSNVSFWNIFFFGFVSLAMFTYLWC
jgi:hypothetical protein